MEVDQEVDSQVFSVENETDDEKEESLSPILDLVLGVEVRSESGVYRNICLVKVTEMTMTWEIVTVGAMMMPRVDGSVNEIVVSVTR